MVYGNVYISVTYVVKEVLSFPGLGELTAERKLRVGLLARVETGTNS